MNQDDKKRRNPLGKIIWTIIALSLMEAEILGFLIVIGVLAGIGWAAFRILRKQTSSATERPAPRQKPLDDCPKPICFHRDKGVHHVLRGNGQDPWDRPNREIDPWDRPDIDIRKYQHR